MINISFGTIKQDVLLEGVSTGIVIIHSGEACDRKYIVSHPKQDLVMSKKDNTFYPITNIKVQNDLMFDSLQDVEEALFKYFSLD